MTDDRAAALALVKHYVKSESLIKHMLGVEIAMRAYARHFGDNEDLWGIVGLLHDFDWEIHPEAAPDQHPQAGAPILRQHGYSEDIIHSILTHADYLNLPRETPMQKTLFAVDELVGFITAVTYVRPSRSIMDVDAAAVRKKMKDKAFARAVNRADIVRGAALLNSDLDTHIQIVLTAMQEAADPLGLLGTQATPVE